MDPSFRLELNSYSILMYRLSFIVCCFSLASLLFFIRFNQLIFHAFPKLLSLNFMHDGHAMSEWKP